MGGDFGDPANPGVFSIDLNVQTGREYTFFVRSVNKAEDESESSNLVKFTWSQATVAGAQVPWPARALSTIDPDFIEEIKAQFLPNLNVGTAAVRIGELVPSPTGSLDVDFGGIVADGGVGFRRPSNWPASSGYALNLYNSVGDENVLPFILYRYQVADDNYPSVSGDISQVSPLIDKVRTQTSASRVELVDPFLEIYTDPDDASKIGLYIRDTQGVVRGATYVYLLVRFKENGEIDRTIPTNKVAIPLVP